MANDQRRSLSIKGLMPGLSERGKIKIGIKGKAVTSNAGNSFQPPQKLDHFVVTTLIRGGDGNFTEDADISKLLGPSPKQIPIRLLYDDPELSFQSRYVCFQGKTMWCSGDGETALRMTGNGAERAERPCPCPLADPASTDKLKCKMNGTLSVIIDGVNVIGGVWKFRTTSYNSIVGISSSLALIQRITGGALAGIPLVMTVSPKTGISPEGAAVLIHVVGIEYRGSADSLQEIGYQRAMKSATHGARIEMVEQNARQLLLAKPIADIDGDDPDDVIAEFYSQEAAKLVAQGNASSKLDSFATPKVAHNPDTGELIEPLLDRARAAASLGTDAYKTFFVALTKDEKSALGAEHDKLKETAAEASGNQPETTDNSTPAPYADVHSRLAACQTPAAVTALWNEISQEAKDAITPAPFDAREAEIKQGVAQ